MNLDRHPERSRSSGAERDLPLLRPSAPAKPHYFSLASILALLVFVIASYITIWRAVPISLDEARVNMRSRHQFETQLAAWLEKLPSDSTLLMYLGDHVGADRVRPIFTKPVLITTYDRFARAVMGGPPCRRPPPPCQTAQVSQLKPLFTKCL